MTSPTKYWQMQILPIGEDVKLKHYREISKAKEFFKRQFPNLIGNCVLSKEENQQVQTILCKLFHSTDDIYQSAIAGLCLRCYVSHRILIFCKTIPHIYNVNAENLFNYTDLLPLVLNDDGKTLIIIDTKTKTQYKLNHDDGKIRAIAKGGEFFSVDILRRFNPNLGNKESLDNWITRLTRQNENIKSFLWEFGLATPSDWGLLCKLGSRSLSQLLPMEDQEIIKAFQKVYQRDRLKNQQKGRCLEPTPDQLQEILDLLQKINLNFFPQQFYKFKKQQKKINCSPKFVWLEAEDFDDARAIIKDNLSQLSEKSQWQIYLKILGQIGFKKYVKERNPSIKIEQDNSANLIDDVCFLWINDFRLCLIIVDNLVDDFIIVPNKLITSVEIAAHFYVFLEVLEEEEKLNIYGFWRYDELFKYSEYSQSLYLKSQPNENFQLPLSLLDTELNNLLLYARFLEPSAINLFALEDYRLKNRRGAESAEERGKERLIILESSAIKLPVVVTNNRVLETLSEVKSQVDKVLVNLSKWWDDIFEEGWQSTSLVGIKVLNNPMWGYARNHKNSHKFSISQTKFFDFGLLLQNQTLALIVNLQQEENGEQGVLVQIIPHQEEYLPPGLNLKITLNPNTVDSISQEVSARQTDNLIQLEFTEESNKEFKVEVSYQGTVFTQEFIL